MTPSPDKISAGAKDAAEALRLAQTQLRLRKAIEPALSGADIETSVDRIIGILREQLPFDLASYAEYFAPTSDDAMPGSVLVRGRYAVDGDTPFRWPSRWLKGPPLLANWIESDDRIIADLDQFYRDNNALRPLRSNEIIRTYEERCATSFLITTCRIEGRVAASLTLARRPGAPFVAADQTLLDALELSDILRLVCQAYRAKSSAFQREVRDLFAPKADVKAVADTIVRRLGEEFEWDYVSIYRVARARSRFELVAQHSAFPSLLMEESYHQGLATGAMGDVLTEKQPRRINRIEQKGGNAFGYIPMTAAQSAFLYPIKLDDEVEWILDCSSLEHDAFQDADEAALAELVCSAEKTIELWFETNLNQLLFEYLDQAVIVVDQANRIQRSNGAAENMLKTGSAERSRRRPDAGLSHTTSLRGCPLARFGADAEARAVLSSGQVATKTIQLTGGDGRPRPMLVSSREVEGVFNRRIWRMSDPVEQEWVEALKYLRTTVQGVAQQTRGPLILTQALIARAKSLVHDGDAADGLIGRALQTLTKADITYERLATNLDAVREPVRQDCLVAFDLSSALKRISEGLGEEAAAINLDLPDDLPPLRADPDRLMFALRSVIGYLLSIRCDDRAVDIRAAVDGRALRLRFFLPEDGWIRADSAELSQSDPTAAQARAIAELAFDSVRAVIEAHGGSIERDAASDGLSFTVRLPIAKAARDGRRR